MGIIFSMVDSGTLCQGLTRADVQHYMGIPDSVEKSVNKKRVSYKWIYKENGSPIEFYFWNNKLFYIKDRVGHILRPSNTAKKS